MDDPFLHRLFFHARGVCNYALCSWYTLSEEFLSKLQSGVSSMCKA